MEKQHRQLTGAKARLGQQMDNLDIMDKFYEKKYQDMAVSYTHLDVYKRQIEFLSMHPGQVFDKERIYAQVCGYDAEGDSRCV